MHSFIISDLSHHNHVHFHTTVNTGVPYLHDFLTLDGVLLQDASPISGSKYAIVLEDAHRPPLKLPYRGPFPVLEHRGEMTVMDIRGSPTSISTDRLKPACVPDFVDRQHQVPVSDSGSALPTAPPTASWLTSGPKKLVTNDDSVKRVTRSGLPSHWPVRLQWGEWL